VDFSRNLGFVSLREQQQLGKALVVIAGVGGDGGLAAEMLARMGVQRFRLADPEVFSAENLNRQNGCDVTTIGINKAEVIADIVRRINPAAEVTVEVAGITPENVDGFVHGADLVIDETEFTRHELAVMIARASRARSIPVLMGVNIGFGSLVTSFMPTGITVERYLGLPETASLEKVAALTVDVTRWAPRLPAYAHEKAFGIVARAEADVPSVAPGVAMAAALIATEAFNHLSGRRRPIAAPRSLWVDAMEARLSVIRWRRLATMTSATRMVLRSRLGRNEAMPGFGGQHIAATPALAAATPTATVNEPPGTISCS
jgi:tRNA threonylcarbamoyladenosine dehydratase